MGKNRKQKKRQRQKQGGRPSKLNKLTDEQVSDVRWLASKGSTHAEIAESLGVSDRTLNRWRDKMDGFWLDQSIRHGQDLYGKPSSELVLCILAEISRLQSLWFEFPFQKRLGAWLEEISGKPHDGPVLAYINKHDRDYLTPLVLKELCINPNERLESGESVLEVIESLKVFEECLDTVAKVEEKISNTEAWKRYSTSEPLRWKHDNTSMKKWVSEINLGEEGSDITSQDTDKDEMET